MQCYVLIFFLVRPIHFHEVQNKNNHVTERSCNPWYNSTAKNSQENISRLRELVCSHRYPELFSFNRLFLMYQIIAFHEQNRSWNAK